MTVSVQPLLAIFSGVPIGFQLGATGTGGALLAVPILVYILGTTAQQAAAMSLVIVAASALLGVWEYGRAGYVKGKATLAFSWTGVMGSWAGAYGHQFVRGEVLLVLFGCLLLLSRGLIMRQRKMLAGVESQDSCAVRFPRTCWIKVAAIGLIVGALNGFFGVGGGFMIVAALVLVLGFPARLAIGTSLSIITLISLGGIARHLQIGTLDDRLTALVILGSAAGMILGARLGSFTSPEATARIGAFITISIAVSLIVINATKLLGGHL